VRAALAALVLALAVAVPGVAVGSGLEAQAQGPRVKPFEPRASDNARLVAAWERWRKERTPRYVTRVQRSCECPPQPQIRTEVRRNRLVSVSDGLDHTLPWKEAWPMDGIYRLLRRGYRDADSVTVRYNERGVPRRLTIDWSKLIADEETILTVRARTGL
jgi:hypothetical protein